MPTFGSEEAFNRDFAQALMGQYIKAGGPVLGKVVGIRYNNGWYLVYLPDLPAVSGTPVTAPEPGEVLLSAVTASSRSATFS